MKSRPGENRKIKILFLIDYFQAAGGTEKHLSYLTLMLDKSRYSPIVMAFDLYENSLVSEMRDNGIPVIGFPVGRYYTPGAMVKAMKLARFIREQNVRIVQTFHFKSDTFGVLAAHLAGVRHVISSRRDMGDTKAPWHYILNRWLNPWIDGFIVVADAVGRVLQKREHVPERMIKTIYNGVDIVKYCPPSESERRKAREMIGLQPEDFVVGTVAWFRQEKNHSLMLEALDLLRVEIPEMRLLWVGNVEGLAWTLLEEVRQRGLEKQVIFAGVKEDVRECIRCFDVAALVPSTNEGFSNAVLEKMAMGVPVIVTDTGGNAEAVLNGYNGFVIPPGSSNALADRLAELHRNPALKKLMGDRSRERVTTTFALETMVRRHEEYYEMLTKMQEEENTQSSL